MLSPLLRTKVKARWKARISVACETAAILVSTEIKVQGQRKFNTVE